MKRIIAVMQDGQYINIPGDRMKLDAETNKVYAYAGRKFIGAFEISALQKIYISEKKEDARQ